MLKQMLSYAWKLPVCGIAFFVGMAMGGALLPALGFQPPEVPDGTDPNTIALWFLLGSMFLAFVLSFVRLRGGWFARWGILSLFVWVFSAVGMVLESAFFMETGAVSSLENSLFTVLNFLLPALFLSAAVAALFRPGPSQKVWRDFSPGWRGWSWRIGAALLAYPVVYIVMGLLVLPFIEEYYVTGQYELTAPTWGQLIPLQLARSALFLLAALPVIYRWAGSRRSLWLVMGLSIAVLTGFMAVITAYWFPWQLRLFHGLELLADGLLYSAVLTGLFTDKVPQNEAVESPQAARGPVGQGREEARFRPAK